MTAAGQGGGQHGVVTGTAFRKGRQQLLLAHRVVEVRFEPVGDVILSWDGPGKVRGRVWDRLSLRSVRHPGRYGEDESGMGRVLGGDDSWCV